MRTRIMASAMVAAMGIVLSVAGPLWGEKSSNDNTEAASVGAVANISPAAHLLASLPIDQDFKNKRASSTGPTGGNNDRLLLRPGGGHHCVTGVDPHCSPCAS